MKALLTDPIVLICSGIFVIGVFGFFWVVGKFWRLSSDLPDVKPNDDLLSPVADLPDMDFRAPVMATPAASSPAVSRDVADRLDSMTQRLTEMQSVLMKQYSGGGSAGAGGDAGPMGQGFSPETIEKLLKIIGNVIQQVDVLQKSLNVDK